VVIPDGTKFKSSAYLEDLNWVRSWNTCSDVTDCYG